MLAKYQYLSLNPWSPNSNNNSTTHTSHENKGDQHQRIASNKSYKKYEDGSEENVYVDIGA